MLAVNAIFIENQNDDVLGRYHLGSLKSHLGSQKKSAKKAAQGRIWRGGSEKSRHQCAVLVLLAARLSA